MPDEAYSILYLLVVRHLLLTGDKTVESGTLFSSRKVYWPFLGSMMAESQQVGGYQTDQSPTQLLQEKAGSKDRPRGHHDVVPAIA